ncbi:MAG: preQ(1) synthase [bacterium]
MAKAEGKIFTFESQDKIRNDFLEVFPYKGEKQLIEYTTKEFSAVCPFSGLPDYGTLTVRYIPDEKCLELKSYKYYLVSFRTIGIFQEAATDRIFTDLKKILVPNYLFVETIYNTRGGIDSKCQMKLGEITY